MSYQRRACIRIPTNLDAQLVTRGGDTLHAKITNLSVTGFQILCSQPFLKNDDFLLKIGFPKKEERFEMSVKVLRSRTLHDDQNGSTYSLGLQIIDPTDAWTFCAGEWIASQLGSPTKRKIVCGLILFTAFAFAFKTALTALGLKTLELPLSDFTGLAFFETPILGQAHIFAGIFLTTMMIFCGLQVLRPTARHGFFFTSTAIFSGIACFAPRLLLKMSLLQNLHDRKMIYFFDFIIFMVSLIGAIWAHRLENRHRILELTLERENIYPPLQKPKST